MRHATGWLKWLFILISVLSCTGQSTEILGVSSTTEDTESYIVTASWNGNSKAITFYDIDGNYLRHRSFRAENWTPRGLAMMDSETIIASGEGNDAIYTLDFSLNDELFFGASTLSGNIMRLAYDQTTQLLYVLESNVIEVINSEGIRDTARYINTNTGSCTLSNPADILINADGNLVVSNIGGSDNILVYDISTTPATCLSSVAFGQNPYAMLAHSDGYLYVATQTDDQIYRADPDGSNATVIWSTDTSIINNPQALAELPNGNILVSGAANDVIEEITTEGDRVGTTPFIEDALSNNIGYIMVIEGSSE